MNNNIRILKIKNGEGSSIEYPLGMVTSVKGNAETSESKTGDVVITKEDIGLNNVANTADGEKTVKNVGHKLTIGNQNYDGSTAITVEKEDISAALGYTPAGGENLVLGSEVRISNSDYLMTQYELSEEMKNGDIYTVSIWGELGADKTGFGLYSGKATYDLVVLRNKINGVYTGTFKVTKNHFETSDQAKQLKIFAFESTGLSVSSIERIKLEPGINPKPKWTPAPEDVVVRSELGKTNVSKGKELPYTWDELKNMCNTGDFKDVEVGDYKTITMKNGETVVMEVAGIDTFYNTGGSENHGQFATTNYAPVPHHIDFISKDCVQTLSKWNLTDYNHGIGESSLDDGTDQPYLTSYIKKNFLESTLLNNLPDDVKEVIIPKINLLERRANVGGEALKESTGWHWYNMGQLWLPSEFEVFGTNIWSCKGYGSTQAVQYPLFANSWEHRIKGQGNGKGRCTWWLCSVASGSSTHCCFVTYDGRAGAYGASSSSGVPVCFRVAAKNKL